MSRSKRVRKARMKVRRERIAAGNWAMYVCHTEDTIRRWLESSKSKSKFLLTAAQALETGTVGEWMLNEAAEVPEIYAVARRLNRGWLATRAPRNAKRRERALNRDLRRMERVLRRATALAARRRATRKRDIERKLKKPRAQGYPLWHPLLLGGFGILHFVLERQSIGTELDAIRGRLGMAPAQAEL